LKRLGEQGMATVKDELDTLADEQATLQGRLEELARRGTPFEQVNRVARSFVETWASVAELLKFAKPEEQRIILRHYVEVLEVRPVGKKVGSYVLRLLPPGTADSNEQSDEPGDDDATGEVPATPRPQKPSGGEGLTFSSAGSQRGRKNSPSRTRTYNKPVNSRLLYH
jgi:hypothetical protein